MKKSGWLAGRVALAVGLCAAVLAPIGAGARSTSGAAAATRPRDGGPPNIVVIETDDMRADELAYMPQTLALLQGTTFTNSSVSTSLCCPSRAAFLSGQYAHNNKVADNNEGGRFDNSQTIATWMHNAGYFTSVIGKYLNSYTCASKIPPGWSHWQVLCHNIYSMYGYTIDDNGTQLKYPGSNASPTNYQTVQLANRAVSTIDEGVASGQPFFLWLTPTAPHGGPGARVAPPYMKSLNSYKLPMPPSFNEADVSDKPAWVQALPALKKAKYNTIRSSELVRLRMLLSVDDMVSRIVSELQAQGVSGNTDIIFTSDNGFMRGEHRVTTGKELNYWESLAVPLVITGPGVPVQTNPAPVQNTDLAPTILDLAGVPASRVSDGLSIVPAISDPTVFAHRAILHRQVGNNIQPAHPTGFGVSADQFFYQELTTGETELYDHRSDPYEINNVVNDPRYAAVVAQLQPILHALEKCAGASCHLTRPDLPPDAALNANCIAHVTTCSFSATASDIDGSVASYSWDFGDGATATGATATHTYSTEGPYTVTLTVTDDAGVQTVVTQAIVTGHPNHPPTASFTYSATNTVASFDASSSTDSDGSVVGYSWDFGDGTTGSGVNPSHDFGVGGDYLVTLTVTDDLGATSSTSQLVSVTTPNIPPVASFTYTQSGRTLSFDGTSSYDPDGQVVQYSWDFGDGSPPDTGDGSAGSGSLTSHTYAPGTYTVTLTVTDDRGGTSSTSQTVTI